MPVLIGTVLTVGPLVTAAAGVPAGHLTDRLGARRSSYLTDEGDHNAPHLMFLTTGLSAEDWGADVAESLIMSAPYWFFSSHQPSRMEGLPPLRVFLVGVGSWSDGTPAGRRND